MTEILDDLQPREIEPIVITTVDGERRRARVWDSGVFECPFCLCPTDPCNVWYAERSWDGPCANPACIVGGRGDAESVAAFRAAEREREAAKTRQAQLAALDEQHRAAQETARQIAVSDFLGQAEEHGWCRDCWNHSTSWGRYLQRPVLIRHRKPGNCPRARRTGEGR